MTSLSYQLYSVRKQCDADLEATLAALKSAGFDGVEPGALHGRSPAAFAAMCQRLGLAIPCGHVSIDELIATPDAVAATAQALGHTTIIVAWTNARTPAELEPLLENLKRGVGLARERGLTLAWHNHDFEFTIAWAGRTLMQRLVDIPGLMFELDLGWVWYAHEPIGRWLDLLRDRVVALHIKDFTRRPPAAGAPDPIAAAGGTHESRFCPVGSGAVGYARLLPLARAVLPHAAIILEQDESPDREALQSAAISLRAARNALHEHATPPRPLAFVREAAPGIGIVGCGNIADIYITNAARLGGYRIAAVTDTSHAARERIVKAHGVQAVDSLDALLARPDVEAVLNITPPAAHAIVARRAIDAGKHVYNEKPLSIELADARALLDAARRRRVLVGCAPDTVLGAGWQTVRAIIARGELGTPFAAVAHMVGSGPETWHPSPAFFYQHGGGPMFDMGPYYITALVGVLGPVARVTAVHATPLAERRPHVGPHVGTAFPVATPTHFSATLEHTGGAVSTLVTSFDAGPANLPNVTIFGSLASIDAPDPNTFGGPLRLADRYTYPAVWRDVPIAGDLADNSRGLGLVALLHAARTRGPLLASGELALHVLEVMHAAVASGHERRTVDLPPLAAPLPGLAEALSA